MKRRSTTLAQPGRRRVLKQTAALGAAALAAPYVIRSAHAQAAADVAPYMQAKIDWKQAAGEEIAVAVIPASYFDNLIAIAPTFEALSGVKLRFEKVPPGQIRQKAMLDLSSKTATYATSATDPMYYPLYVSNKWIDPLDRYLGDSKLTDAAWFNYDDILKAWRDANSYEGKPYAIPYDGEVTVQVYRKDLYDAKGLKAADTLDEFLKNAAAINDPANRVYGMALRGFAGAGQNMYIYPSLFKEFGGNWFSGNKVVVNSPEAVRALDWYVDAEAKYAPPAVRNWNWPDIADTFSQGTLGCYIDAHSSAAVLTNPEKSKVIGKIAFARWPKGPTGKRCTSIWNWGFPINAALSDKQKRATWLFIQWAAAAETQARTSWKYAGAARRSGLNRTSLWKSPDFLAMTKDIGPNFVEAALTSLEQDTDVDWRPRVPQWPAIGDTMATAIQAALVGQKKSKEALDEAQARIRRQFGPEGAAEVPILDYPAIQRELMPRLATTYGLHFAVRRLQLRLADPAQADSPEVEVVAAGLKAYASESCVTTLQAAREACGGAGYMAENRFAALKADTDVFTTFEGANLVLYQLVAKGLLTRFREEMGDLSLRGAIRYLAERAETALSELNPVATRRTEEEHLLDPEFHLAALAYREERLLRSAAMRIRARLDDGMDSFQAVVECQDHLISLARAHVEHHVFEAFGEPVARASTPGLSEILRTTSALYALSCLERDRAWFLEAGYFEPVKARAIRGQVGVLCSELREHAPLLVAGFGIPPEVLPDIAQG